MMDDLKAVLLFLAIVVPASIGFQWTSSSQIPDGSSFRACVGERASFPWSFSLSTGEHVISVEWYRTTDKGEVLLAGLLAGHFLPTAGQNVTFVPSAGLQVGHLNLAEFGTYSVRVNCSNNGSLLSNRQTAFLTMEDAPVLVESRLVASVCPEPVLDDITGRPQVQLLCGQFLSLGSRPVSVVWKTPSDHTVASTAYSNGTFRLNLPHPTQSGRYYCHLKDPSVAARCIPNVSRLMGGAYIHVDEVQIRLTLLEGGLQGLQAKDEKLDVEMDRQAGLDSELQLREQNLTAEVDRLAEITKLLLMRTEKLTSDSDRLTKDNEKLKTQTEKLASDNEKLESQTEKLASENEKLKTQTDKLMTDNEKQKTHTEKQMQTMTSQFTEETAKLSRRVNNMFADTMDLSMQLSTLKSRSEVATKRIGFCAYMFQKNLIVGEIFTSTNVTTNEGGAFDGTTGTFTVPVSGTYLFLVNIAASRFSKNKGNRRVEMLIDGETKLIALSSFYNDMHITGSCHGLFHLTQGQKVWIKNIYVDSQFWDDVTTFVGALLHPDLP